MSERRQPSGTAFALRDPLPWGDLAAIVRASEDAGYEALFLPEIAGRDAFVTLGSLAGETRHLLLGTGVVPMGSRTTMLTAMAAATVHERSRGRLVLGLGTGGAGAGALDRLRERVVDLRALLDGQETEVDGARGGLTLAPGSRVPIWISALGPRAMRLAGEVADGVLLNWCPPERVAFAAERIREGAERAGRDPGEVAIAVYVRSWVGEDETEAWPALAEAAAQYASIPAYARQFEQVGLGGETPEALARAVCAVGDGARDRIEACRDAGADLPVVYPVATADAATADTATADTAASIEAASDAAASIEATLSALAPG